MAGYLRGSAASTATATTGTVAVTSVNAAERVASGTFTTDGSECSAIDCRTHVGAVQVTPAVGEIWNVEQSGQRWRMVSKVPMHTVDLSGVTKPAPGQVQIGSSGPLELFGSEINVHGTLGVGPAQYRDEGSGLERSADGGENWLPVVPTGGPGSLSSTDELPEGTTNRYYTDARVTARITALFGSTSDTITQGNDPRLSDTRNPNNNSVTTAKILDDNVTLAKLAPSIRAQLATIGAASLPYDISFPQTTGYRAVGYGQNFIGVKLARPVTFSQVIYRCGTADASGSMTVELRKNGTPVVGTGVTISYTSQVIGAAAAGSWVFDEGDILTVYVSAVGGTPGLGLVADIKGLA